MLLVLVSALFVSRYITVVSLAANRVPSTFLGPYNYDH